jgi:hypothetical protein
MPLKANLALVLKIKHFYDHEVDIGFDIIKKILNKYILKYFIICILKIFSLKC